MTTDLWRLIRILWENSFWSQKWPSLVWIWEWKSFNYACCEESPAVAQHKSRRVIAISRKKLRRVVQNAFPSISSAPVHRFVKWLELAVTVYSLEDTIKVVVLPWKRIFTSFVPYRQLPFPSRRVMSTSQSLLLLWTAAASKNDFRCSTKPSYKISNIAQLAVHKVNLRVHTNKNCLVSAIIGYMRGANGGAETPLLNVRGAGTTSATVERKQQQKILIQMYAWQAEQSTTLPQTFNIETGQLYWWTLKSMQNLVQKNAKSHYPWVPEFSDFSPEMAVFRPIWKDLKF